MIIVGKLMLSIDLIYTDYYTVYFVIVLHIIYEKKILITNYLGQGNERKLNSWK